MLVCVCVCVRVCVCVCVRVREFVMFSADSIRIYFYEKKNQADHVQHLIWQEGKSEK